MSTTLAAALIVGLSTQAIDFADPPSLGPFLCTLGDSEMTLSANADGSRFSGTLALAGEYAGMDQPERLALDAKYDGWRYVYENADMTMVIAGNAALLYGEFGMSDCIASGAITGAAEGGETAETGTAITWGGNVRSGPGQDYARVAGVPMGVEVALLGRSDAPLWLDQYPWFRVRLPSGQEGYIAGGLLCSREGRDDMYNDRDCEG